MSKALVINGKRTWRFTEKQAAVLDGNVVGDWRAVARKEPWTIARALNMICRYHEEAAGKLLQPYGLVVKPNRPQKKRTVKKAVKKAAPDTLGNVSKEQLAQLAAALLEKAGYKVTFK